MEMGHQHITCDLFVFTQGVGTKAQQYKNLATLSDLTRKSSGNLFYYPEYSIQGRGQLAMKFSNELYHSLTRRTAWEAVFRIRCSNGFN